MKIKGNEKYEFYSIQLQCHSTSHSTQPNRTHGWTQPMSISGSEGYSTPQLRAPCSVSRHISQSLTSYSDHISSVCSRWRTHYVLYIVAVFWSISLKVNEFNGFNDLCQTASVNDVDCWNRTLFTNNFMFIVSYCCYYFTLIFCFNSVAASPCRKARCRAVFAR